MALDVEFWVGMTVKDVFAPLVGQMVWNAAGGSATFLTFEFGEPHLSVRDPVKPKHDVGARVERLMLRRRVTVKGDLRLFVEFAKWRITTANGSTNSDEDSDDWWKVWLDDISGQHLAAAEVPVPGYLTLRFDMGGILEVWPLGGTDSEVWTLHRWQNGSIGCRPDGILEIEPKKR
jgi:hypothetical protein